MSNNISDMVRTAPDGTRYIRPYDAAELTGLKIEDTSFLLRTAHYRQYRLVDGDIDVAKTVQTPFLQDIGGHIDNAPSVAMFKAEDIEKILESKNA